MKNLKGGECECSQDDDDCDVIGFKIRGNSPRIHAVWE